MSDSNRSTATCSACWRGGVGVQQLCQVLVVLCDLQVVVALHHAVQGLQVSHHQLEQGGLPGTVGAHQRHPRIKVNRQVNLQCNTERLKHMN